MPEAGHEHRFGKRGFARIENVAAAMDMDQKPIAVLRCNHLRRNHESAHSIDHRLIDRDVQPLGYPGNVLDGVGGAGVCDRLPFLAGLWQHVPVGAQRQADDFCHLRADRTGHRHRMRGNLKHRRICSLRISRSCAQHPDRSPKQCCCWFPCRTSTNFVDRRAHRVSPVHCFLIDKKLRAPCAPLQSHFLAIIPPGQQRSEFTPHWRGRNRCRSRVNGPSSDRACHWRRSCRQLRPPPVRTL